MGSHIVRGGGKEEKGKIIKWDFYKKLEAYYENLKYGSIVLTILAFIVIVISLYLELPWLTEIIVFCMVCLCYAYGVCIGVAISLNKLAKEECS